MTIYNRCLNQKTHNLPLLKNGLAELLVEIAEFLFLFCPNSLERYWKDIEMQQKWIKKATSGDLACFCVPLYCTVKKIFHCNNTEDIYWGDNFFMSEEFTKYVFVRPFTWKMKITDNSVITRWLFKNIFHIFKKLNILIGHYQNSIFSAAFQYFIFCI